MKNNDVGNLDIHVVGKNDTETFDINLIDVVSDTAGQEQAFRTQEQMAQASLNSPSWDLLGCVFITLVPACLLLQAPAERLPAYC